MIIDKAELRKSYKKLRSSISKQEVRFRSDKIYLTLINKLFSNFDLKQKVVAVYLSANDEVETDNIIKYLRDKNISYATPKVKSNGNLDFILFEPDQLFNQNAKYKNIKEAINGKSIYPDILITPLLAFDSNCNRLGMGGGFYDRAITKIKTFKPSLVTIGVAYSFQKHDNLLPIQPHDQKLDYIICEEQIFPLYTKN